MPNVASWRHLHEQLLQVSAERFLHLGKIGWRGSCLHAVREAHREHHARHRENHRRDDHRDAPPATAEVQRQPHCSARHPPMAAPRSRLREPPRSARQPVLSSRQPAPGVGAGAERRPSMMRRPPTPGSWRRFLLGSETLNRVRGRVRRLRVRSACLQGSVAVMAVSSERQPYPHSPEMIGLAVSRAATASAGARCGNARTPLSASTRTSPRL